MYRMSAPTPRPLDVYALLGHQLSETGLRWEWTTRDGAQPTLRVEAARWRPTGLELAGHALDAEQLLASCADYPYARVELPAAPAAPESDGTMGDDAMSRMDAMLAALAADASWMRAIAEWLTLAGRKVADEVRRVDAEAETVRRAIADSKFGDWHISACDQHARTIRVDGRSLQLSLGVPLGLPADLSTIYLWPLLSSFWKVKYRPRFGLLSADYGARRIKIELGRGGPRMPKYWVDLGARTVEPV